MKHNYKMKNQLISLSLLCLSAVAMAQNIGDADIVEHTISKTIVDFGDTYIETTKSDVFYIKAPETNTANISVKVLFDEDRNNNCYNPNDVYATEFTKGIFEVFVDGVELVSTEMTYTSFFSENDMGNTTIEIAPGDSSRVEVKATPANHYGPQYLVEDGNWEHCYMGKEPIYSLEYQSDLISIQNITNSEISTVGIGFNGTNDPTDVAPCIVNIPDANFKAYLVGNTAINTNEDAEIQCSEAIAFAGSISCHSQSISNLTGIEAFSGITELWCHNNSLINIDVSNNINLTALSCGVNSLSSLDISNNLNLTQLYCASNSLTNLSLLTNTNLTNVNCSNNIITSLDVSNNINLTSLECNDNSINNIDVSNHPNIIRVVCTNNALDNLNVANGNNTNVIGFSATGNPSLTCIQVDDTTYSTTNWTDVDTTASFSVNCSGPNGVFSEQDYQVLSIYPNPASSIISTEEGSLQIIDGLGNIVLEIESAGKVDVSSLESGIYFVAQNGKSSKLIIE